MTKQRKAIIFALSVIFLLMGVGYATLSNVSININGLAVATANDENFKVVFTGNKTDGTALASGATVTTTVAADSTKATVLFEGLKKEDDEISAILEVKNASLLDITAKSVTVKTPTTALTGSTTTGLENGTTINDYIQVTAERCNADGTETVDADTTLAKDAVTYVKVTAKLLKETPVNDITNVYEIEIEAEPEDAN